MSPCASAGHSISRTFTLVHISKVETINVFFLGICPAEWNRPRKRLCVVLITENTEEHNYARSALRHIALQSVYNPERVRFAYIFKVNINISFYTCLVCVII